MILRAQPWRLRHHQRAGASPAMVWRGDPERAKAVARVDPPFHLVCLRHVPTAVASSFSPAPAHCPDYRGDSAQPDRRSQRRPREPFHRAQDDIRRPIRLRRRAASDRALSNSHARLARAKGRSNGGNAWPTFRDGTRRSSACGTSVARHYLCPERVVRGASSRVDDSGESEDAWLKILVPEVPRLTFSWRPFVVLQRESSCSISIEIALS